MALYREGDQLEIMPKEMLGYNGFLVNTVLPLEKVRGCGYLETQVGLLLVS